MVMPHTKYPKDSCHIGHDLKESCHFSLLSGPPFMAWSARARCARDAAVPVARFSPSGSSPISSGLLRMISHMTGIPSASTMIPDTIHVMRQFVAIMSSVRNGIKSSPPIEPPEATMLIAMPRFFWNHLVMIAPVVPGAIPPEKKEMMNPNSTISMITLFIMDRSR